jgi:folate-dependent phosphoribosylglycinamide formyltransferase PurN
MKVIFLTGSHPRHAYLARALNESGYLSGLVIEDREEHVPDVPTGLSDDLSRLFKLHFSKRSESEKRFFGSPELPEISKINVSKEELNGTKVLNFINSIKPDLIISYGVHILSDEIINSSKGEAWNIHGGLSPWYKGNITHFWPSYMLEPQMTGMTIHNLTQDLDAGDVVHQNIAELIKGDGVHDVACRVVLGIAKELPMVIKKFENEGRIQKFPHKLKGKLWTSKDWRPEHLKLIYDVYNDKIVDEVLMGNIKGKTPKIFRQFD